MVLFYVIIILNDIINFKGGRFMRRNRTKSRRGNTSNKALITIIFIILLPIVSISIGYFGVKYIIIPKFFSQESYSENKEEIQDTEQQLPTEDNSIPTKEKDSIEEPQEASSEENTLKPYIVEAPPLSIFSVQVGSFNDTNHAQVLVDELRTKGLDGHIIKSNNYKVITRSFLDRENAEKYKEVIKDQYSDAFIFAINIAKRSIPYGEEDKNYGDVIGVEMNKLISFYNEYYNFLISNDLSNITKESTTEFVNKKINKLSEIESLISKENPTNDFSKLNENFLDIVKTTKSRLTELKESENYTSNGLWRIFIEEVNKYMNIV